MTIQSYGYTGAVAPNEPFANWQQMLGQRGYRAGDSNDCKPTGLTTGTYQVKIDTGWIGAHGVADNITAAEIVTLVPPSSGRKYYLICAHRDWAAKATTMIAIDGGTTLPASLPARTTGPGVADDHPLALVSLNAGDSVPTIIYDLRMWGGNENLSCFDMPQNYLAFNQYAGNRIRFTSGIVNEWVLNPNTGNGYWDLNPEIVRSGPNLGNALGIVGPGGWATVSVIESRGSRAGNEMTLLLQASHSSSTNSVVFSGTAGSVNGGDVTVMTVGNTGWRPPYDIPVGDFEYRHTSGGVYGGAARYLTDGRLVVTSGAAATEIGVRSDGGWSVRAVARWTREPSA